MMETTRELAAKLYGHGEQSAEAHNALYDGLRTLSPADVAAIIRQALPQERYSLIAVALENADRERAAQLKSQFTAAEIAEMVKAK